MGRRLLTGASLGNRLSRAVARVGWFARFRGIACRPRRRFRLIWTGFGRGILGQFGAQICFRLGRPRARLLRYGLVTIIAAAFFIDTLDGIGLGVDWKTWDAPAGLANVALLLGIAVYAFWSSLGSRDLFDEAAG